MTSASLGRARASEHGLFREVLAVLLLTIGSLVPVIPWVVGAALLWTSPRWRLPERLLGTLVWPLGYLPVLALGTIPSESCGSVTSLDASGHVTGVQQTCSSTLPIVGIVLMVLLVLAPLAVGAVLLVLAHRRTRGH